MWQRNRPKANSRNSEKITRITYTISMFKEIDMIKLIAIQNEKKKLEHVTYFVVLVYYKRTSVILETFL